METLDSLETADESSGNSATVKSEDGSPNHGSGRSSPPPNCAICLGRCRNKSFTDSCLHQFCFKCLLTWSRVKTECPLCKQNFKSIIHNVKSNHQYEEYRVQQPQSEDRGPNLEFSDIFNAARRFRYRTTLTLPRRETMAIRQFLLHYPLSALMNELPARAAPRERTRRSPADFRRTVYRHNLWARHLPDFTGRFRDCSPDFFRYNDSQVHRLVPWLSRELFYLLNENSAHVTYVLGRILDLLPLHPILSAEFRSELQRYFGERTDHFLHEFHCFASTPYDITGYDRHVQYQTDAGLAAAAGAAPGLVSEVLSSSDSDSHDSDIVMVSSSHAGPPAGPPTGPPAAGTSRAGPAAPTPAYPHPAVIPIETISHSDSGSDSEVMVVGYIKPPHQRTPELVDLLASDSDVVMQEPDETSEPEAAPAPAAAAPAPAPRAVPQPLVRVQLSMRRSRSASTDDSQPSTPPPRPARRWKRVQDESYTPSSSTPSSSTEEDEYDRGSHEATAGDSSSSSNGRKKRTVRRRPRSSRGSRSRAGPNSRDPRLSSRDPRLSSRDPRLSSRDPRLSSRDPRLNNRDPRLNSRDPRFNREAKKATDGDRRTKGKSKNGKDVKSSRVDLSKITLTPESAPAPASESDRAGPSGLYDSSNSKRIAQSTSTLHEAAPSGLYDDWKSERDAKPTPALDGAEPSAFNDSNKKFAESTPMFDGAGPSDHYDGSKRKRTAEPAPVLDSAGSSGINDGSKKKKSAEPASELHRAGPSGIYDSSRRKKIAEPAPELYRAGPSGLNDSSKSKKTAELAPALNGAEPSGLNDSSKSKRTTEPTPAFHKDEPGLEVLWTRSPVTSERTGSSRKNGVEQEPCRRSRENRESKRLRSVVKVMKRDTTAGAESSESRTSRADGGASAPAPAPAARPPSAPLDTKAARRAEPDSSSDDNIPLRLAMSKEYGLSRTYVSDFSD